MKELNDNDRVLLLLYIQRNDLNPHEQKSVFCNILQWPEERVEAALQECGKLGFANYDASPNN